MPPPELLPELAVPEPLLELLPELPLELAAPELLLELLLELEGPEPLLPEPPQALNINAAMTKLQHKCR